MRDPASRSLVVSMAVMAAAVLGACTEVQDFRTTANEGVDGGLTAVLAPDAGCGAPDDAENCGLCGHSCLGGECREGVCQPFVIAENVGLDPAETQVTDQGAFAVAADDEYVYFMDTWSELFRVRAKAKAGKPTSLARTQAFPRVLTLHDAHLYFAGIDPPIGRIHTAGGRIEDVSPPAKDASDQPVAFVLDGGALVWIDGRQRVLRCAAAPCAAPEVVRDYGSLFGGKVHPAAVAASRGRVYVSYYRDGDSAGQSFAVDNISGAGIVPLVSVMYHALIAEPSSRGDFDVVFGVGEQLIARAITVGSFANMVLASGAALDEFPRVVPDGDYLYFLNHRVCPEQDMACTSPYGSIMRVKKDGSTLPETVLRTAPGLHELAIHDRAIYFTTDDGRVLGLAKPADEKTNAR